MSPCQPTFCLFSFDVAAEKATEKLNHVFQQNTLPWYRDINSWIIFFLLFSPFWAKNSRNLHPDLLFIQASPHSKHIRLLCQVLAFYLFSLSGKWKKNFFPLLLMLLLAYTQKEKVLGRFLFFLRGRIKTENYFSSLFSVPFGLKLIFMLFIARGALSIISCYHHLQFYKYTSGVRDFVL